MKPDEFHRAVITATAFGDDPRYAQLRKRFEARDHRGEFEHLNGTAVACLAVRLGGRAESEALDRAALRRFMDELRAAGPGYWFDQGRPSNFLEVEGVVRALRGESHLIADVSGDRLRFVFRFLVRYLTGTVPEIREDFDAIVDRAREHLMRELFG